MASRQIALRFASARRGLLAQRTFTSKSRVMLGTHARTADAQAPAVFYKISTATGFRIPYRIKLYDSQLGPNPRRMRVFLAEKGALRSYTSRLISIRVRIARPSS